MFDKFTREKGNNTQSNYVKKYIHLKEFHDF
ncbi:hypothetical protein GGE08_001463 [Muricauda sp. ARW1Y1]|nr:hypothetical protein [Muricauda sp. ARW1Y1]